MFNGITFLNWYTVCCVKQTSIGIFMNCFSVKLSKLKPGPALNYIGQLYNWKYFILIWPIIACWTLKSTL